MDFKESKFFNQSVMTAAREKQRERDLILNSMQQLTEKLVRLENTVAAQSVVSKDLLGLIELNNEGIRAEFQRQSFLLKEKAIIILTAVAVSALAIGVIIGLVF